MAHSFAEIHWCEMSFLLAVCRTRLLPLANRNSDSTIACVESQHPQHQDTPRPFCHCIHSRNTNTDAEEPQKQSIQPQTGTDSAERRRISRSTPLMRNPIQRVHQPRRATIRWRRCPHRHIAGATQQTPGERQPSPLRELSLFFRRLSPWALRNMP